MKLHEMKAHLKDLASRLRQLRPMRKPKNFDELLYEDLIAGYGNIDQIKYEYRHKHIAYCLKRGRTYEQIERPVYAESANMTYVNKILGSLEDYEDVHSSAQGS